MCDIVWWCFLGGANDIHDEFIMHLERSVCSFSFFLMSIVMLSGIGI